MTDVTLKVHNKQSPLFFGCKLNSYWLGGFVLVAAALLYFFTLDNGLQPDELTGGDLITHQYAQVEGRPGNAPGYPLYTLAGWLWFRLGRVLLAGALNPTQILSFYSTLWGLVSLLGLYLILLQITHRQHLIAGLLTAFYAVTYFFWYYSITTEQYTSAVFQTLLIIWLAFRWEKQPGDRLLLWLALVSGTMLANMVTTLFILPPLLWFILSRQGLSGLFAKPKLLFQAAGLAGLPLLSYTYVFSSGALHPEWRGSGEWPNAWAWFIDFLTIQQGRAELTPGLSLHNFFTSEFPALIWHELTWPIFLGGLIGLAYLGQRRAIFLYSTLLIYVVFCWLYRFGNWFQVIIPAYPIFIIGCAAGIAGAIGGRLQMAGFTPAKQASRLTFYVLYIFLIFLLVFRFTTNLPRANQHNLPTDTGLDPGWAILADQPQPPALIAGDFAERVALQYLSSIWGITPGIYLTAPGDFAPPEAGQVGPLRLSTYITRRAIAAAPQTVLPQEKYPQAAGEQLVLLSDQPVTELPTTAQPLELQFGDILKLTGWEQTRVDDPLPQEVATRLSRANWQVALYWQTSQVLAEDYTISVRPLVGGQVVTVNGEALIQDHQPVWDIYPTSRWQPGELVRDIYALPIPPHIVPEAIQIIVYKRTETGFENLGEQTIVR